MIPVWDGLSPCSTIGLLCDITEHAGGESPGGVVINPTEFFILRGVFGRSPRRLRIDMRRLGIPWLVRKQIMDDWRHGHPSLAHLAPK